MSYEVEVAMTRLGSELFSHLPLDSLAAAHSRRELKFVLADQSRGDQPNLRKSKALANTACATC
jgi:hypothetical protein